MVDFHQAMAHEQEEVDAMLQQSHQASIYTALPGIITGVNLDALTVTVQPAIKGIITQKNGVRNVVAMPLLPDVPIYFPRGGGYTLTFPIAVGDECLVVFSSRCIDSWWQSGGVQSPTELRMHDLSDGFALIGPFSQVQKIANVSATSTELRSNDNMLSVSVDQATGTITLKSPTAVVIDTPVVHMTGNLQVDGDQITTGTNTTAGIGATTHHHVSGGGVGTSTGGPLG